MTCEDYEPDGWDYRWLGDYRRSCVHDPDGRTEVADIVPDVLLNQPCPRCGEPSRLPPAEIAAGPTARSAGSE